MAHWHEYTINEPAGYLSVLASYVGSGCWQNCPSGHTACQLIPANITNVNLVKCAGAIRYTSIEDDTPDHTHTLVITQLDASTTGCSIIIPGGACGLGHDNCRHARLTATWCHDASLASVTSGTRVAVGANHKHDYQTLRTRTATVYLSGVQDCPANHSSCQGIPTASEQVFYHLTGSYLTGYDLLVEAGKGNINIAYALSREEL